jgi:hypothetical protein
MMTEARLRLDCLLKIRSLIAAQQVTYGQQTAEQRQGEEAYAESRMSALTHEDDINAGFAASDPKEIKQRPCCNPWSPRELQTC